MTLTLPDHIEDELTQLELLLDDAGQPHLMRLRAFMLQQETLIERAREARAEMQEDIGTIDREISKMRGLV